MVEERFNELMEFFGGQVDIAEDSEGIDFNEPIKGKYVCRIVELLLNTEPWPSGDSRKQWDLNLQAVEDIEGEPSGSRYFRKKYDLNGGSDDFPKDATAERTKLFNALATADVKFEVDTKETKDPDAILTVIAAQLTDQLVNISAWPMELDSGKTIQVCRIVKEFKVKGKKKKEDKDASGWK